MTLEILQAVLTIRQQRTDTEEYIYEEQIDLELGYPNLTLEYEYVSQEKVKNDYGIDDGCACLVIYYVGTKEPIMYFRLYKIDGKFILIEEETGTIFLRSN